MTIQNLCSPLWAEGMFLTPQHLQQIDRYEDAVRIASGKTSAPFHWGISKIEIDEAALASKRFSLQKLEAITPDGVVLFWPGNLELQSRSFEGVLNDPQQRVTVYLGVPDYATNRANLSEDGSEGRGGKKRFLMGDVELTDENNGRSERTILLKRLNASILFEGEDMAGYQVLPVAAIKPGQNMEGAQIDDSYFPPVTSMGAWPPLMKLAQSVATRMTSSQTNLGMAAGEREIVELCSSPRGIELLLKYQTVGQSAIVLQQLSRNEGVSPYVFFCELLRAVALLRTFSGNEALPKMPVFEHRRLGECMHGVTEILNKLLGLMAVHSNIHRPFVSAAGRMEVDLEPDWLTGGRRLFVRVTGAGGYEETVRKMSGIKFTAPTQFAQVVQRRLQGVQVSWMRRQPNTLPPAEGGVYGEINQTGQFWSSVQNELALVAGGAEEMPYRFDLFVE